MRTFVENLNEFLELFFPSLCITCGDRLVSQEKFLCFKCWNDLPVSNFHVEPENKVAQLFWGRINIENATSYFHFRKGSKYQQLIHFIKYKGLKELGFETGKRFGLALAKTDGFKQIDYIIPVPLHSKKFKQRGYNQSEWIANGIAESMHKTVVKSNLFRKVHTSTQTRKNRIERWHNVEKIFTVKNQDKFDGKHILLVDDVVTTGATLEACAAQILKNRTAKVSIATLAFADL